jgi:dihydroflavonol-4-reductase
VVAVGASFSKNEMLNEESPYNLSHLNLGYFETKLAAEKLVIESCKKSELDAVVLNPSTIYGPGDAKKGSRSTQVKVAQGRFPFYTSGGVSVVDVDDVTDGILAGWRKGRTGERYILSGDNITIKSLFEMISSSAGAPRPKYLLPTPLLHGVGIWGDLLETLGLKSSVSRENAWTATLFHWFDHSKATRELDFKPRPAGESIEKSVTWMKENGYIS